MSASLVIKANCHFSHLMRDAGCDEWPGTSYDERRQPMFFNALSYFVGSQSNLAIFLFPVVRLTIRSQAVDVAKISLSLRYRSRKVGTSSLRHFNLMV